LYDPQTSGGLLISLPENQTDELLKEMRSAGIVAAAIIGRISNKGRGQIHVK
jgi:selenide,water dikinase